MKLYGSHRKSASMHEKIVPYASFENVIKANIVKTKLDAFGIPCFLTGENFVNLYPLPDTAFSGVKLFIFERDRDRVKEILEEDG